MIYLKYLSQDLNFLLLRCYQLKTIGGRRGTEPAYSTGVMVGTGDSGPAPLDLMLVAG